MTDNVIISIKGKQLYAESGPDEMELEIGRAHV